MHELAHTHTHARAHTHTHTHTHTQNGVLLGLKKNETLPFAATWMEKSVRERQIPYDVTLIGIEETNKNK